MENNSKVICISKELTTNKSFTKDFRQDTTNEKIAFSIRLDEIFRNLV